MKIPYFHVDAFTSGLFTGNPAGVCLLESWPADSLLQNIAAENNLAETAFVVLTEDGYDLRWFTPTIEMDLCGHATLAASFVLDLSKNATGWPVTFNSASGRLTVTKENDLYFLDFPSRPPKPCPERDDILAKGLGISPAATFKSRDYLAVYDDQDKIISLKPDFITLAELDCMGVIATAPGHKVDFVSRFFAPRAGIPEDPVTGSSHCTLIPYWSDRTAKQEMFARQLSPRGGKLVCRNCGERVQMGGNCVLYHSGYIQI